MNDAWSNADANGDGKLNRAEFGAWAEAMRKMKEEEGNGTSQITTTTRTMRS